MNSQAEKGVTLIELMVALSILVLLMTIGVPSMAGFIHSQKLDSAVQLLKDSYIQARYEAVTTQQTVTLCPLDVKNSSCGDNWSSGVLAYLDNDSDNKFDPVKDDLLKLTEFSEGVEINYNNGTQIKLTRSGGPVNAGHFEISVPEMVMVRLIISPVGRIRKG